MSVFSVGCTFPDEQTPLSNATSGWDVVYAVKYSVLNAHIAAAENWKSISFGGSAGNIVFGDGFYEFSGTVAGLQVVRGASGQQLRFKLRITNAMLEDFSPNSPQPATDKFDLIATIPVTLTFSSNPSPSPGDDGLKLLRVDADQPITPLGVNFSMVPISPPPGVAIAPDQFVLEGIVQRFLNSNSFKTLLKMDIAQVYHDDYARSVNIPWALPTKFSYATADLLSPSGATPPDDHGVLAVLGSVDGDVDYLSSQINPLAIPIDANINGIVLLNANLLSRRTFAGALAKQLDMQSVGELEYDEELDALVNRKAIKAFYVKGDDGNLRLLSEAAAHNTTEEKFPAEIARGAFRFRLDRNSIKVELSPVKVDLDGYELIIKVTYDYQIMVDEEQNIDIVLAGDPVVETRLTPPEISHSMAASVIANAVAIIAAEAAAFGIDSVFRLTPFGNTKGRLDQLTREVVAAKEQALAKGEPVELSLGASRKMIISSEEWNGQRKSATLTDQARRNVNFPPLEKLLEPAELRIRSGDVELTLQDLLNRTNEAAAPDRRIRRNVRVAQAEAPQDVAVRNEINLRKVNTALLESLERLTMGDGPFPTPAAQAKLKKELASIIKKRGKKSPLSLEEHADLTELLGILIDGQKVVRLKGGWRVKLKALKLEPLKILYSSVSKVFETGLKKMNVTFREYYNTVSKTRAAAGLDGLINPAGMPFVYARRSGKPVKVPRSLLQAVREELQKPIREPARLPAVREFIERFEAPMTVKAAGYALYIANLAVGQIVGGYAQDGISSPFEASDAREAENVEQYVKGSPKTAVTLINAVRFDLMKRREDDSTAPAPSAVLRCAAVNGGLVLGVSISNP